MYALLTGAPERLENARYIQLDEWAGRRSPTTRRAAPPTLQRTMLGPLAVPSERRIDFRGDAPDAARRVPTGGGGA